METAPAIAEEESDTWGEGTEDGAGADAEMKMNREETDRYTSIYIPDHLSM